MSRIKSREDYFPIIEKRYGEPISYWLRVLSEVEEDRYPVQISKLIEDYGFSRSHANQIVMYFRGSKSAQRYANLSQYYKDIPNNQAKLIRAILKSCKKAEAGVDIVIAWNKPVVMLNGSYILGISSTKTHILLGIWDGEIFSRYGGLFKGGAVLNKSIRLPIDWVVDEELLNKIFAEFKART